MEATDYEIQKLVELSGVPRRNIYFYVQQGLLPPPTGAGLAARYGSEHLLRLKLIPMLRARGLRLDQIRERFSRAAREELESLLAQNGPASVPREPRERMAVETDRKSPSASGALCTRYDLPGGIALYIPADLNPRQRVLVEKILHLAGEAGE